MASWNTTPDEVDVAFEAVKCDVASHVENERIFQALEILDKWQADAKSVLDDGLDEALKRKIEQTLTWVEFDPICARVTARAKESMRLLKELRDVDGWSESKMSSLSFRVTKRVGKPMMHILPVIAEIDLYSNWFPMMKYSKEVASISRSHKIAHCEIALLWPINNRDVVIDAYAVDLPHERSVLINLKSIETHADVDIPPLRSGVSRAKCNFGGYLVEYVDAECTQVSCMFNLYPQLAVVPQWLINFISGKLYHVLLLQIEKAASLDGEYAERVAAKPETYAFAQQIVDRAKLQPALHAIEN